MKSKIPFLIILPILIFLLLGITHNIAPIKQADLAVIELMKSLRSETLTPFFILLTTIGSWHVTAPAWLLLTFVFLVKRKGWIALVLTVVFWGSRYFNWLLKEIYSRPRPEVEHLVSASHFSFPSGHAMNSMAFYGFLFLLAGACVKGHKLLCSTIQICLFLLVLLIGISRMYLGVHYFSDVIAGFCAGFAWMYGFYCLYRWYVIEKRHKKYG